MKIPGNLIRALPTVHRNSSSFFVIGFLFFGKCAKSGGIGCDFRSAHLIIYCVISRFKLIYVLLTFLEFIIVFP